MEVLHYHCVVGAVVFVGLTWPRWEDAEDRDEPGTDSNISTRHEVCGKVKTINRGHETNKKRAGPCRTWIYIHVFGRALLTLDGYDLRTAFRCMLPASILHADNVIHSPLLILSYIPERARTSQSDTRAAMWRHDEHIPHTAQATPTVYTAHTRHTEQPAHKGQCMIHISTCPTLRHISTSRSVTWTYCSALTAFNLCNITQIRCTSHMKLKIAWASSIRDTKYE